MKPKLSKSITLEQFENGYWYATQIKEFADRIGIPSANAPKNYRSWKAHKSSKDVS